MLESADLARLPSDRSRKWEIPGDTSGVFDELSFPSADDAISALRRNGFKHFAEDEKLQSFLRPPEAPFHRQPHPNGPIYSSGGYWVE